MSERSVAEIIGWNHSKWWGWHRPECNRIEHTLAFFTTCLCHHGPTADDLLVWLRERHASIDICACHIGQPDQITISIVLGSRAYEAPTLHAVLEAAVRAVAEVQP